MQTAVHSNRISKCYLQSSLLSIPSQNVLLQPLHGLIHAHTLLCKSQDERCKGAAPISELKQLHVIKLKQLHVIELKHLHVLWKTPARALANRAQLDLARHRHRHNWARLHRILQFCVWPERNSSVFRPTAWEIDALLRAIGANHPAGIRLCTVGFFFQPGEPSKALHHIKLVPNASETEAQWPFTRNLLLI